MGRKTNRTEQIKKDRLSGMTCKEVAEKHGVSFQYVQQVCAGLLRTNFQFVTEDRCVYPNLRKWMNENRVCVSELVRRLGLDATRENFYRYSGVLSGKSLPRKDKIDQLIKATGMTYEELFCME